MADEADVACGHEEFLINKQIAYNHVLVERQEEEKKKHMGVCLYCREKCDVDKSLHDYCEEDYRIEQHMMKISGRRH